MSDTSYGTSSFSSSALSLRGTVSKSPVGSKRRRKEYLSQISGSSLSCYTLVVLGTSFLGSEEQDALDLSRLGRMVLGCFYMKHPAVQGREKFYH